MTISEFARTLWAGRYVVLLSILVVMVAAYAFLSRGDVVYKSTATVELASASVSSIEGGATQGSVSVAFDPTVVTSEPVAAAAAAALGVPDLAPELATQVSAAERDGLVEVTASSSDPQESQAVANAFATAYTEHLEVVLQDQIAAIDRRRAALRTALADVNERFAANPNDVLAQAERDSIVSLYQDFSAQVAATQSIVQPGRIVSLADPGTPDGAPLLMQLSIAGLVGAILGVALALSRRGLDTRVYTGSEVETLTGSPVLAEIAGLKPAEARARSSDVLPVSARLASPFTESVREFRTAVQGGLDPRTVPIVVVTAADQTGPRPFIAANLAASWALSGRRTVLVAGDLRRPGVDTLLPPPPDWSGHDHHDQVEAGDLRPTRVPNLRLFLLPDEELEPADFLASTDVRELIGSLRRRADMIIVDAPPVLAGADATILAGYANAVIMLAFAGRTDRRVLKAAAERLRINNVPVVGVVLAGVVEQRWMRFASTYGDLTVARPAYPTGGPDEPNAVAQPEAKATEPAGEAGERSDAAVAPSNESGGADPGLADVPAAVSGTGAKAAKPGPRSDSVGEPGPGRPRHGGG